MAQNDGVEAARNGARLADGALQSPVRCAMTESSIAEEARRTLLARSRIRNSDQVRIDAGPGVDEEESAADTGPIVDDRAAGSEPLCPLQNRLAGDICGRREPLASPVLVVKHGEEMGAGVRGPHVPGDQRVLAHGQPSTLTRRELPVGGGTSWKTDMATPVSVIGARAPHAVARCRAEPGTRP